MFDCILVNGDSYSAKDNGHQVYADFLQEHLGMPVYNIARSGSNNQRITRSTLEKIHQYKNPLVLIGWSFINRIEVWYYGHNPDIIQNLIPDQDITLDVTKRPKFITLDHLIARNEATLEQKCLINDNFFVHKQLTDFYTNLYMFAHTLESMDIPYKFFSAACNTESPINCFPYIESLNQVQWCTQNKNFYKLHDFCIPGWAKENDPDSHPITGHLSEHGHKKFASFLQEIIQR
jgi:hypothetical protein